MIYLKDKSRSSHQGSCDGVSLTSLAASRLGLASSRYPYGIKFGDQALLKRSSGCIIAAA
jgi:hypothetical protein